MPAVSICVRLALAIWQTGKKSLTYPARAKDLFCHRSSTRSEAWASLRGTLAPTIEQTKGKNPFIEYGFQRYMQVFSNFSL
jgi:hypothetical protein